MVELIQEGEEVIINAEWDELKHRMLNLPAEHGMLGDALEDLCIVIANQPRQFQVARVSSP